MATFRSLTPPMGSHQSRQAPNTMSIELELDLPQDHFLPAEDIQAQVWTNVIHRHNPDGPEVWSEIPMKLSHVIPGQSIAVFATRLQPTGRGDFGLTARWKSHKDMTKWQWAPTATEETDDAAVERQRGVMADNKVTKDVSIAVRVPRNISGTSSWTMGPQSVMVFGQDGPRVDGAGVGGPGLYLGNHAAATRARISGYEAVLSLVGDLLDFDEKIPESDKELNKAAWQEQATASNSSSYPKRFSSISRRSSSIASLGVSLADLARDDSSVNGYTKGLSRRSSVADFMLNYEPGNASAPNEIFAAVVDEPVDPPRLVRKSSVTDMMVQAPPSSSKRCMNRSSGLVGSSASLSEFEQESGEQDAATTAAPNTGSKASHVSNEDKISIFQSKKEPSPTAATSDAAAEHSPASTSIATPPASGNSTKGTGKKKKGKKEASTIGSDTAGAAATALPPVPTGQSTKTDSTASNNASGTANDATSGINDETTENKDTAATSNAQAPDSSSSIDSSDPPSSAKVVSSLSRQFGGSQQNVSYLSSSSSSQALSSLHHSSDPVAPGAQSPTSPADDDSKKHPSNQLNQHQQVLLPKQPFQHKVISIAPGAHNVISDAILKEAVDFLRTQIALGKKVLVHCRDGNGRSGSVAVAYIAAQLERTAKRGGRRSDSLKAEGAYYDEALREIWKWKCDVYPHKGLKQSVARIVW
ncbi:hypothetical protein BC939DRAFT_460086 [Gamsiella multidivaricata]|uniref:uncharacterized protein n=1 Tax=Gamsiella multidivaricata TaxID=101098 RepID=UPI00221E7316|nr:uncharacterized protein BC939DRAFT_460086 [Gamsiella multidivaricata]KAI7819368.1 hypothetical protein BC939DRAFT_460086 [Gamsiella multidivaricata]